MDFRAMRARFRDAECATVLERDVRGNVLRALEWAEKEIHHFEDVQTRLDATTFARLGDLIEEAEMALLDFSEGVRLFGELLIDGDKPERNAMAIGNQLKELAERNAELASLRRLARAMSMLRHRVETSETATGAAGGDDA